jgi:orotidine-5'-phosphate decarboxylase
MKRFRKKLDAAVQRSGSLLCVGLDPDIRRFPSHLAALDAHDAITEFNRQIIDATSDLASAYKPNLGFYVAHGVAGLRALEATRSMIPADIPVILDCKIGDFDVTSTGYALGFFDEWNFDAITIAPYMGEDGLAPLMADAGRAVFVLCKTSNPGSGEFQDLAVLSDTGQRPLFEQVAIRSRAWEDRHAATVGLVVGATYPEHLSAVRALCPDQPILMPGLGAQSGNLAKALKAGLDSNSLGLIPSSSRSVLYAGDGADFAASSREAAQRAVDALNAARQELDAGG